MDYNKVILMGRLTRDTENRKTQSGTSICSFTLAVSRKFTSNGQQTEETCFVDISAFGKTAEICGQYLSKGSPVLIDGRLKLDQWQDRQTGENRQKLSVMAESVQLLGRREDNGNRNDNGYQQQPPQQSQPRRVDQQYAPPPMPSQNDWSGDVEDDMNVIPF